MRCLFVIPALNEEKNIKKILIHLNKIGDTLVIDDGSKDNTYNLSKKLSTILIKNKKNYGYDRSIKLGLKYALKNNYDYAITFDGDNQHKFSDAKKILNKIKNYDVIVGCRNFYNRKIEEIISIISYKIFKIKDPLTGMKCYNLKTLKKKIINLSLNKDEMGMFCLNWVNTFKVINLNIHSNLQNKKSSMNIHGDIERKILKCFLIILKKNL